MPRDPPVSTITLPGGPLRLRLPGRQFLALAGVRWRHVDVQRFEGGLTGVFDLVLVAALNSTRSPLTVASPVPLTTYSHWSAPLCRLSGPPSASPGPSVIWAAWDCLFPSTTRKPLPNRRCLCCISAPQRRLPQHPELCP